MSDPATPRRVPTLRLTVGAAIVVIIGVFAVVVAMGVVRSSGGTVAAVPFSAATAEPMYVHVSGAVELPGVYVIDDGARIVDAIAAAGGFRDDAMTDGLNLARLVIDGEQIVVPARGAESDPSAPVTIDDGLVNINTADAAELEELPRIGEAMSERIITYRETNGPFRSIDDLANVPRIGPKMLESLRPLVKVG